MIELVILLWMSCSLKFLLADKTHDAESYSRCAFPCARRGKQYTSFDGSVVATFPIENPKVVIVTTNTSVNNAYCIERVGPFYLQGRTINGVNEYACFKDTRYDQKGVFRIFYLIEYKPVSGRPDICEVCNGENMIISAFINLEEKDCEKVIPRELGCNIPWFCPIVNATTQKQCSPCEPSEDDDGLCCV